MNLLHQFLEDMESIGDEAEKIDMIMVKLDSATAAEEEYGLKELPAVVHFSGEVPSIFGGNMTGESVMHWLQEEKMERQIRQVRGTRFSFELNNS